MTSDRIIDSLSPSQTRACPHDTEAQAELMWQQHRPSVVRYARTLLSGDTQLAEDVAQETALRLCRHLEVLDRPGSLHGWLNTVARNIVIDMHRRQLARPTEVVNTLEDIDEPNPASDIADDIASQLEVRRLLETLEPAQRDVIRAVYLDDRTMSSAAAHLGVPIGTVKSRTHHALKSMHDQLRTGQVES